MQIVNKIFHYSFNGIKIRESKQIRRRKKMLNTLLSRLFGFSFAAFFSVTTLIERHENCFAGN